MNDTSAILLVSPFVLAYAADLAFGDPQHFPHPVRFIGMLSGVLEKSLYQNSVSAGLVFWLAINACVQGIIVAAFWHAASLPTLTYGLAVFFMFSCLATRSLHKESEVVEKALKKQNLELARTMLSMIVGRDTSAMSFPQIRRAAIETVAENISDGVVAPMFYCLLFGVPGMMLYKTVNTLDSMVGYKNARYMLFGRVAARVDDVLNYLPARLSAVLIVCSPITHKGGSGKAWQIVKRDARKTSSPNAGWPEAAMAGALGVQLGGPGVYFGKTVHKEHLGDAEHILGEEDYARAVKHLYWASMTMAVLVALTLFFSGASIWGLAGLFFE